MQFLYFFVLIACTFAVTPIQYNLLEDVGYRRLPSPNAKRLLEGFDDGFMLWFNFADTPMRGHGIPGLALIDYDNDGDVDIYVGNTNNVSNSLLKNQWKETGVLSFVDVAVEAGVTVTAEEATGICFGDIDNDGDDDMVVLNRQAPWTLFRNEGDGTFTDVSQPGLVYPYTPSSCAFGDYDNDGYIDLYIGNVWPLTGIEPILTVPHDQNEPNVLYRNRGPNQFPIFEDISSFLPQNVNNITWQVSMVDYDLDGDVDLFNSDDNGAIRWFERGYNRVITNYNDELVDETIERGTNFDGGYMGLAWGDWNCDGNLDFFSPQFGHYFTWHNEAFPIKGDTASHWFLGNKDGRFRRPGIGALEATPFGWGGVSVDMENDGDQDIIYFGGLLALYYLENNPGAVLENVGCSANFVRSSAIPYGSYTRRTISGTASADLNLDGFPDIVSVSAFDVPEDHEAINYRDSGATSFGSEFDNDQSYFNYFLPSPPFTFVGKRPLPGRLYIEVNSGNENNFVLVQVKGTKDLTPNGQVNRNGIGAVLSFTPLGGQTVMKPVEGGTSYASQDGFLKNFGLGSATSGVLTIFWPKGVFNSLQVVAGETVVVPEIPCSYKSFAGDSVAFEACVDAQLSALESVGEIDSIFRTRLRDSNVAAYTLFHSQ